MTLECRDVCNVPNVCWQRVLNRWTSHWKRAFSKLGVGQWNCIPVWNCICRGTQSLSARWCSSGLNNVTTISHISTAVFSSLLFRKRIARLENWTACAVFFTGVARHPRAARNGIVCCCVLRTAYLRRTPHCVLSINWDESAVFRFFVPGDLDLWPWLLKPGEIFVHCT